MLYALHVMCALHVMYALYVTYALHVRTCPLYAQDRPSESVCLSLRSRLPSGEETAVLFALLMLHMRCICCMGCMRSFYAHARPPAHVCYPLRSRLLSSEGTAMLYALYVLYALPALQALHVLLCAALICCMRCMLRN